MVKLEKRNMYRITFETQNNLKDTKAWHDWKNLYKKTQYREHANLYCLYNVDKRKKWSNVEVPHK